MSRLHRVRSKFLCLGQTQPFPMPVLIGQHLLMPPATCSHRRARTCLIEMVVGAMTMSRHREPDDLVARAMRIVRNGLAASLELRSSHADQTPPSAQGAGR